MAVPQRQHPWQKGGQKRFKYKDEWWLYLARQLTVGEFSM